jgi:hypothetical protein
MDSESVCERVRYLVDQHFPWSGAVPRRGEERLGHVHRWLERETAVYRSVAQRLIRRMEPILSSLRCQLAPHERKRFLYRIDDSHVIKTPEAILEKMARLWVDPTHAPPVCFDNLDELNDLGRFRIVTNFLSDVELISARLEDPFDATKRQRLSSPQRDLHREFTLQRNHFENLIELAPGRRKSGERCHKGIFSPRRREHHTRRVEVQILTAIQEAWDKKDHAFIYEPRRAGHPVTVEQEQLSYSLSEQLYLADLTFERLKQAGAPPPPSGRAAPRATAKRKAR